MSAPEAGELLVVAEQPGSRVNRTSSTSTKEDVPKASCNNISSRSAEQLTGPGRIDSSSGIDVIPKTLSERPANNRNVQNDVVAPNTIRNKSDSNTFSSSAVASASDTSTVPTVNSHQLHGGCTKQEGNCASSPDKSWNTEDSSSHEEVITHSNSLGSQKQEAGVNSIKNQPQELQDVSIFQSEVTGVYWSNANREWRRKFVNSEGKEKCKSFGAQKYGFDEAKHLAENADSGSEEYKPTAHLICIHAPKGGYCDLRDLQRRRKRRNASASAPGHETTAWQSNFKSISEEPLQMETPAHSPGSHLAFSPVISSCEKPSPDSVVNQGSEGSIRCTSLPPPVGCVWQLPATGALEGVCGEQGIRSGSVQKNNGHLTQIPRQPHLSTIGSPIDSLPLTAQEECINNYNNQETWFLHQQHGQMYADPQNQIFHPGGPIRVPTLISENGSWVPLVYNDAQGNMTTSNLPFSVGMQQRYSVPRLDTGAVPMGCAQPRVTSYVVNTGTNNHVYQAQLSQIGRTGTSPRNTSTIDEYTLSNGVTSGHRWLHHGPSDATMALQDPSIPNPSAGIIFSPTLKSEAESGPSGKSTVAGKITCGDKLSRNKRKGAETQSTDQKTGESANVAECVVERGEIPVFFSRPSKYFRQKNIKNSGSSGPKKGPSKASDTSEGIAMKTKQTSSIRNGVTTSSFAVGIEASAQDSSSVKERMDVAINTNTPRGNTLTKTDPSVPSKSGFLDRGPEARPPKGNPKSRGQGSSEVMAKMYFHRKKEAWRAEILIQGIKKQKSFSCRLYGFERARMMCEWARRFVLHTNRLPTDEETCSSLAVLMRNPLPTELPPTTVLSSTPAEHFQPQRTATPPHSEKSRRREQTPALPKLTEEGDNGRPLSTNVTPLSACLTMDSKNTNNLKKDHHTANDTSISGVVNNMKTETNECESLGISTVPRFACHDEHDKNLCATAKIESRSVEKAHGRGGKQRPRECSQRKLLGALLGASNSVAPTPVVRTEANERGNSESFVEHDQGMHEVESSPASRFLSTESNASYRSTLFQNQEGCVNDTIEWPRRNYSIENPVPGDEPECKFASNQAPSATIPFSSNSLLTDTRIPFYSNDERNPEEAMYNPLDQSGESASSSMIAVPWGESREFEELQPLRKLTRPKGGRVKRFNVGKKPFSGVRGIYFQQGLWKVKYRGDQEESMKLFPYTPGDVEGMQTQFRLARTFLRQVIEKGRHLHDSDGEGLSEDEPAWLQRSTANNRSVYRREAYMNGHRLDIRHSKSPPSQNSRRRPSATGLRRNLHPSILGFGQGDGSDTYASDVQLMMNSRMSNLPRHLEAAADTFRPSTGVQYFHPVFHPSKTGPKAERWGIRSDGVCDTARSDDFIDESFHSPCSRHDETTSQTMDFSCFETHNHSSNAHTDIRHSDGGYENQCVPSSQQDEEKKIYHNQTHDKAVCDKDIQDIPGASNTDSENLIVNEESLQIGRTVDSRTAKNQNSTNRPEHEADEGMWNVTSGEIDAHTGRGSSMARADFKSQSCINVSAQFDSIPTKLGNEVGINDSVLRPQIALETEDPSFASTNQFSTVRDPDIFGECPSRDKDPMALHNCRETSSLHRLSVPMEHSDITPSSLSPTYNHADVTLRQQGPRGRRFSSKRLQISPLQDEFTEEHVGADLHQMAAYPWDFLVDFLGGGNEQRRLKNLESSLSLLRSGSFQGGIQDRSSRGCSPSPRSLISMQKIFARDDNTSEWRVSLRCYSYSSILDSSGVAKQFDYSNPESILSSEAGNELDGRMVTQSLESYGRSPADCNTLKPLHKTPFSTSQGTSSYPSSVAPPLSFASTELHIPAPLPQGSNEASEQSFRGQTNATDIGLPTTLSQSMTPFQRLSALTSAATHLYPDEPSPMAASRDISSLHHPTSFLPRSSQPVYDETKIGAGIGTACNGVEMCIPVIGMGHSGQ